MGLDQYAYTGLKGQREAYYEAEYGEDESKKGTVQKPREIAYWRKHPNLQGWMEQLWIRKLAKEGVTPEESEWGSSFNGVELELTLEDIDDLEQAVLKKRLPKTSGFFFGSNSDEYYREHDLEFIRQARADLFCGLCVFYNSSW